ncbi:MAG: zinc dependent phospholipase C family protein [Candidatus Binatia bacterium]|nr:zinc dependent phospholipase C family protein [Candidatus Binatia bacterium]
MRVALLFTLFVALLPDASWAWGPMTHLTHGATVLAHVTILGAGLQRLLRKHRWEFLYGCVGADITQAKKYTRSEQAHCHSWRVGWSLLAHAANDVQRAFAYGYLTHLAGDVFSHNHYVPVQLVLSYRSLAMGHVYWEARFDTLQSPEIRTLVRELRQREFPQCDELVRTVVSRTLFSFETDKRIFNSFIAVHDLDQWHRIIRRLAQRSQYTLPADLADQYNRACWAAILDMLEKGSNAANQSADPTGLLALRAASDIRRMLRALERNGPLPQDVARALTTLGERRELKEVAQLVSSAVGRLAPVRDPGSRAGADDGLRCPCYGAAANNAHVPGESIAERSRLHNRRTYTPVAGNPRVRTEG